jgi:hypothetical protein
LLVITIDLVPGGYESYRRPIGSMRISNLSDLADTCDYLVEIIESANPLAGTQRRKAACTVREHDRRQSVIALLARACEELLKADFFEL